MEPFLIAKNEHQKNKSLMLRRFAGSLSWL